MPSSAIASSTSSTELSKPNALIAMRPTRGRLTTVARKVYNSILYQTQLAILDPQYVKREDGFFESPLRVLLTSASINADSGQTLENVKRYLEEMQSTQVDWLAVSLSDRIHSNGSRPGEEVLFDSSGLLYRSKIVRRDGALWVSWLLPAEIVEALGSRDVLWTRLQLQTIAKLGSYTAVALYEICSRYKTHVAGLTARQSVEWWTDALNQSPGGSDRREWRKFKAEKLKAAIDEINAETDINVELIEHKKGRAIAEAQFAIKRVARTASADTQVATVDLAILDRGRRAGIGTEQMTELCRRFGDDRVRAKLRELEARLNAPGLPPVNSVVGYFKSLLRSDGSHSEVISEIKTDASAAESVNQTEVKVHHAVDEERQRVERQSAELEQRIRAEFEMLSEQEREEFAERTLKEFLNNPACTPLMRGRVQQRRYDHPMLVAVVRNAFAEARYGINWRAGLPEA